MAQYNYKMIIAYDGTQYGGWQIQPNATSIQSLIQNALKILLHQDVNLIGSGRTDAGVHAKGQTAHFKCDKEVDIYRLQGSLNGILPFDIRILHVEQVPIAFHAQRSAISKTYHYYLCLGPVQDPFHRLYATHVRSQIDISVLQKAASMFIGKHDFTSFANQAHEGSASKDAVRTITCLDLVPHEGGLYLKFQADGFLYKMVRNITGTLLEVAQGKRDIDDIPRIFSSKDRRQAGQAAPAHGLFLMHVDY